MSVDAPPTVPAVIIGRQFKIVCPYCGKTHWHGAGDDPTAPAYGHRVAHCGDERRWGAGRGYTLVPVEG